MLFTARTAIAFRDKYYCWKISNWVIATVLIYMAKWIIFQINLEISHQNLNSKCSILDFRLHVFDIMCRGCKWHFDCMQNSERRSKNDSQEP